MASRFTTSFHMDFCYKPVRISKNGIVMYVPCGKCNGCLLQKANSMSFRLGDEIENGSNAIFATLTYSNRYVPKLECRVEDGQFHYHSAANNWRWNGKTDVLRDPVDFYSPYTLNAPLKNYYDSKVIGYLSKTDIQLFLKILRKKIYENRELPAGSFRYYIIGEYGPGKDPNQGKFRPHYHCVFLPDNEKIATFMLRSAIYESWKMCDKGLFEQYTKYCDSGTRHYVTEYVTGNTLLPSFLSKTKEIKPFALMSKKKGALGVGYFDKKKVLEDIESGIDSYYKRVARIERNYIFQYSTKITNSLFSKCSRFNQLSFDGLLRVYEHLFNLRKFGEDPLTLPDVVYNFSIQDYNASLACLKACDLMGWTPFHYVEVLDQFYYRKAQRALRLQYEFQQKYIDNPYICIGYYFNWRDYLGDSVGFRTEYKLSSYRLLDSRLWFLKSFGFGYENPFDADMVFSAIDNSLYQKEVDSIIEVSDKSKKVNSVVGQSPHIV